MPTPVSRRTAWLAVLVTCGAALALHAWWPTEEAQDPHAVIATPALFSFIQPLPDASPLPAASLQSDATVGSPAPTPAAGIVPLAAPRALFERTLLATADGRERARQRVDEELRRHLPADQAARLLPQFDKYARYHQQAAVIQIRIDEARTYEALKQEFDTLRSLRSAVFTLDEIAGLFPADDAYEEEMLQRMTLRTDTALDDDTRQTKLLALEAALPPTLRELAELRGGIVRQPGVLKAPPEIAADPMLSEQPALPQVPVLR